MFLIRVVDALFYCEIDCMDKLKTPCPVLQ